MVSKKSVTILGSTGSVGWKALEVIEAHEGVFSVEALTAWSNWEILAEQAKRFGASMAVIGDESYYQDLKDALAGESIHVGAGESALIEAAERPSSIVVAAISGVSGLRPTLSAAKRGARVALANKESLVAGGSLLMDCARRAGGEIFPLDSEHSALFRLLLGTKKDEVRRITLTASGGPFLHASDEDLASATPQQACRHPVWSMGKKISVDSATLMNKALELIEAHYLFAFPEDKIDVLLHPQSVVHAMVEKRDGSLVALMEPPDMRAPLRYALFFPDMPDAESDRPSPLFQTMKNLEFSQIDPSRFPAIRLARQVLQYERGAPIILNAGNELAVEAFLQRKIGFPKIIQIVEKTLESTWRDLKTASASSLDDIFQLDALARRDAQKHIAALEQSAA